MSSDLLIRCGKCKALNQVKALSVTAGGRVTQPRHAMTPEALNKLTTFNKMESAFEQALTGILKEKEKDIIAELIYLGDSDILSQIKSVELKDLTTELISRLKAIMDASDLGIVTSIMITKAFTEGIRNAGRQLLLSFTPNRPAIDFIRKYTFKNIKDMTEEIAADLRGELERGLMNQEGPKELTVRVRKVFKVSETRAKAIARTELNRAYNQGHLEGYRQSGLDGEKEWKAHIDTRTSDICRRNNGQRVPLNEKFKDRKTGEEFMIPPFHVNCRSRIVFHPTPPKRTSEAEVKAVEAWNNDGLGATEMGRLLGRPNTTIYNILGRLKELK